MKKVGSILFFSGQLFGGGDVSDSDDSLNQEFRSKIESSGENASKAGAASASEEGEESPAEEDEPVEMSWARLALANQWMPGKEVY